jgi:hypothetical protein
MGRVTIALDPENSGRWAFHYQSALRRSVTKRERGGASDEVFDIQVGRTPPGPGGSLLERHRSDRAGTPVLAANAWQDGAPPEPYDARANPRSGLGARVTGHSNDVVSGSRVIGRDLDPFIREEILRHSDSGWPD